MTFVPMRRTLITGECQHARPQRNHCGSWVRNEAAIAPLFAGDLSAWSTMANIIHAPTVHHQQLRRDPT
jgi:hypothetical protein